MSIPSRLLKLAIKLTPNVLVIWLANWLLKGIAELLEFRFDVDSRRLYVQVRLYGEKDCIAVLLEDFALFKDGDCYRVILNRAQSDRPWLTNLLARVTGTAWKIPSMPQYAAQLDLIAELFQPLAAEAKQIGHSKG